MVTSSTNLSKYLQRKVDMTHTRFIILSFSLLSLILLAYFLSFELWITRQSPDVPYNYKEFLLKNTPSPKIVVDSGSNGLYGIDPEILEREFHMPTINLADNINYSIKHKFHYLAKYAQKGDIIILPLEWRNYGNLTFYSEYIESFLRGNINYYYHSLPLIERMQFVFTGIRLNNYLTKLFKNSKKPDLVGVLNDFREKLLLNNGDSLGAKITLEREFPDDEFTQSHNCDVLVSGAVVSEQFKETLKILNIAKEKGASVIFTWPVAVDKEGNHCYKSDIEKTKLTQLVRKIRHIVQQQGFIVVGNPMDSVFPSKYFHNNFYHPIKAGMQIRTRRLANRLKEAGITPSTDDNYQPGDTIHQLQVRVELLLEKYTKRVQEEK